MSGHAEPILCRERGDRFALVLANRAGQLAEGQQALRGFLERRGVEGRSLYASELVFEEAVTNILRHAFDHDAQHVIDVDVAVAPETVTLSFTDDGKPFDPCAAPAPQRPESLASAAPGGLGVSLMRRMSETMTYRRIGDRNRLEVRIRR
jgi:anti-sigma regulatory factor (Ser/Thr protein kinase)